MAGPYTMLLLFGLLPFICGGMIAGLLNKGYKKGTLSGALIGVNLMVGMVLMMGLVVLAGSLITLTTSIPFDMLGMFSGLYEGWFDRNLVLYILSGFEAVGVSAAFGSLIGALRGPAEEED